MSHTLIKHGFQPIKVHKILKAINVLTCIKCMHTWAHFRITATPTIWVPCLVCVNTAANHHQGQYYSRNNGCCPEIPIFSLRQVTTFSLFTFGTLAWTGVVIRGSCYLHCNCCVFMLRSQIGCLTTAVYTGVERADHVRVRPQLFLTFNFHQIMIIPTAFWTR